MKYFKTNSPFIPIVILSAVFFTSLSAQSNAVLVDDPMDETLKSLEKTFRYGSWEQQASALRRFYIREPAWKTTPDRKADFFRELEGMSLKAEDLLVQQTIVDIYKKYPKEANDDQVYSWFKNSILPGDTLSTAQIQHLNQLGNYLIDQTNALAEKDTMEFFTNEDYHRDHQILQITGLEAWKTYLPKGGRELLKDQFREIENKDVKRQVIRALIAYKDTDDLSFLEDTIYNDAEENIIRWVAVSGLAEYAPDERAYQLAKNLYTENDIEIRARALYALGFFSQENGKELLLQAAKDNSAKIRYYALEGLKTYKDEEEIVDLFKYKWRYDSEFAIKKQARQALIDWEVLDEEGKLPEEKAKEEK